MPQQGSNASLNVDLTRVTDPEVRKAFRNLVQQVQQALDTQQIEIEAMLEMMVDKHVGSLSEFKRNVQKIQQRTTERAERVHLQLSQTLREQNRPKPVPAPAPAPASQAQDDSDDPEPGRHVYRL
jgi:hypothetical protein